MAPQELQKRYSPQEMQDILQRALKRQDDGGVTREELQDTARELGVAPEHLEQALQEHGREATVQEARTQFLAQHRRGFMNHLTSYAATNAGLLGIDFFTGMHGWSVFPMLGWGIGLAIHGFNALSPSPDTVARGTEYTLRRMEAAEHRMLSKGR